MFLHCYCYKYQIFAVTSRGDIWRIFSEEDNPLMQKLIGDEDEWRGPIRVLKSMAKAYD